MGNTFEWPDEGWKEEDFTLEFIYDLHGLVGINGPDEFANMLAKHDLDLCRAFCSKWTEYNKTEYWKTKEQKPLW